MLSSLLTTNLFAFYAFTSTTSPSPLAKTPSSSHQHCILEKGIERILEKGIEVNWGARSTICLDASGGRGWYRCCSSSPEPTVTLSSTARGKAVVIHALKHLHHH